MKKLTLKEVGVKKLQDDKDYIVFFSDDALCFPNRLIEARFCEDQEYYNSWMFYNDNGNGFLESTEDVGNEIAIFEKPVGKDV